MELRGTSGFLVESHRSQPDLVSRLQDVIDGLRADHEEMLDAVVESASPGVIKVRVVLRSSSYEAAENSMDALAAALREFVTAQEGGAVEFEDRGTELVPA